MNSTLFKIYDIFRGNISLLRPIATISQYNPHYGFSKKKALQTFESKFPKLIFENRLGELSTLIDEARKDLKGLQKSYKTYCTTFLDFLDNVIDNNGKRQKSILKKLASAYHIDGTQSLVDAFGGEDKFIEKAIQESYFFAPELAQSRLLEITNRYIANQPLPARWQGERKSGVRPQSGYNFCDIDTNGNAKVRSIINDLTGYSVSAGDTDFINYKISHIWQKQWIRGSILIYGTLCLCPHGLMICLTK